MRLDEFVGRADSPGDLVFGLRHRSSAKSGMLPFVHQILGTPRRPMSNTRGCRPKRSVPLRREHTYELHPLRPVATSAVRRTCAAVHPPEVRTLAPWP